MRGHAEKTRSDATQHRSPTAVAVCQIRKGQDTTAIGSKNFSKSFRALETCLRIASEGSAVLLIEDGVYGAMNGTSLNGTLSDAGNRLQFYVLGPDLKARGLSEHDVT